MTVTEIRRTTKSVFRTHDVRFAGLFGSYARGKPRHQSDIDIAVVFKSGADLLTFIELKNDLRRVLKKPVDLVSYRTMYPQVKRAAKLEMRTLYGKAIE